jgi:starvation-inducible DNA-binding protein
MSNARSREVAEAAAKLLADSYTLYLKTHNFHWNVTGPMFNTLHTMFETQYTELALAVDEIAERIRAIGQHAPGSYAEFGEITSVRDGKPGTRALDMVRELGDDQLKVAASAKELIGVAEKNGDDVSVDLGVRRMQVHEKTAWMLRSHLED